MPIRSILAGALALAALQVLVADPRAYEGLGGLAVAAGALATWFLSPSVAAIPDRRSPDKASAAVGGTLGRSVPLGAERQPATQGVAAVAGVLRAAVAQIGKPYRFDTQGPDTFDCSGLVTFAYRVGANIPLVPSSFTQADAGVGVPVGAQWARPGDLVFTRDSEGRSLGHVGIAVDGNQWITAPHTGAVVHVSPIPWSEVERVRRVIL